MDLYVFRKLAAQLRNIARRWSARPLWSASLGLLLTILIVSGPLACVVHCAVADVAHATHHAAGASHAGHHHAGYQPASTASVLLNSHALLMVNEHGDHALCEYVVGQSSEVAPSALTIGVVLVVSLMLPIAVVSVRHADCKPHLRLLTLPPPLAPPRFAPSLA